MNSQKRKTILKSVLIVLVLFTIVFALRAQSAGLHAIPDEIKADYTDASGLPYFSEMDSYFNLRMTMDYMDHGYFGDTIVNGSGWDMHSYYPSGREVGSYQPMIAYVTSALYGIINMFTSMSLKEVAFWTGAFIASFAVIPTYIFARRITNDYGAIAASLLVSLGPNYFAHTFAGFFDTDMFNVTLPLFFILFFIESLRSEKLSHKIIFGLLSVISIGLFSLSWTGFMYYPAIMILALIVFFILCHIFKIKAIESPKGYSSKLDWLKEQKELFSLVFVVVIGLIGLLVLVGPNGVVNGISGLTGSISLQNTAANIWPNVFISVAEMQVPNVLYGGIAGAFLANSNSVVNGVGGIVALFGALLVLYSLAKRAFQFKSSDFSGSKKPPKGQRKSAAKKREDDMFRLSLKDAGSFGSNSVFVNNKRDTLLYLSIFIVWILGSVVAVSVGTRFIQVLVVPMGLLAGIFVGFTADYVRANIDKTRTLFVIAIVCAFLIAFPVSQITDIILPYNFVFALIIFVIVAIISVIVIYGFKSLKDADISIKKTLVVLLITIALISPTFCGAYQTAETVVPGSSDPMWNAMDFIKEDTAADSVIVSWWDFGYLFQIASDHSTSFDGGSQTGDRAFWVGKSLSTSDLALSKGILQMLATTGDNATNLLCEYTGSNVTAVDALLKILPMDQSNAKTTLMKDYKLTAQQASAVVKQSHPAHPKKVEFILSSDMIQKAGWWSYFGSWDFDKLNSTNYNYYVADSSVNVPAHSKNSVTVLSDGGVNYTTTIDRTKGNTTAYTQAVYANNGSIIDVNGTVFNPLNASHVMVIEDGYLVQNKTIKNDGNYTLFVVGNNNEYSVIIMDDTLRNSVFTRLYFLGGAGQDTFKLEHMESGVAVWTIGSGASSSADDSTSN